MKKLLILVATTLGLKYSSTFRTLVLAVITLITVSALSIIIFIPASRDLLPIMFIGLVIFVAPIRKLAFMGLISAVVYYSYVNKTEISQEVQIRYANYLKSLEEKKNAEIAEFKEKKEQEMKTIEENSRAQELKNVFESVKVATASKLQKDIKCGKFSTMTLQEISDWRSDDLEFARSCGIR